MIMNILTNVIRYFVNGKRIFTGGVNFTIFYINTGYFSFNSNIVDTICFRCENIRM